MIQDTDTQYTLYKKVVKITNKYVGPAADRFVSRQVQNHLNKDPNELEEQDLVILIDWISIAMALLTEDENVIKRYVQDLRYLISSI
jgi:hypothetical protein